MIKTITIDVFVAWLGFGPDYGVVSVEVEIRGGRGVRRALLTAAQVSALPDAWLRFEIEAGGDLVLTLDVSDFGHPAQVAGGPDSWTPEDPPEFSVAGASIELSHDDDTVTLALTPKQLEMLCLESHPALIDAVGEHGE